MDERCLFCRMAAISRGAAHSLIFRLLGELYPELAERDDVRAAYMERRRDLERAWREEQKGYVEFHKDYTYPMETYWEVLKEFRAAERGIADEAGDRHDG